MQHTPFALQLFKLYALLEGEVDPAALLLLTCEKFLEKACCPLLDNQHIKVSRECFHPLLPASETHHLFDSFPLNRDWMGINKARLLKKTPQYFQISIQQLSTSPS